MKEYSYIEAVTADVLEYIQDNYSADELKELMQDRDDFAEHLNDDLWIDDSVTGNGSGSYTFNREQAKEYVLSDCEQVLEAAREFCFGMDAAELMQKLFNGEWEYFDVTARCYVLGQAIDAALDEIETEKKGA